MLETELSTLTDSVVNTAEVDFATFDRISTYDAKRVCRRLANRKSEGTTEWLRTNVFIKDWLNAENSNPRLWISGKGRILFDLQ